jgi:hypothetical protein
MVFPRPVGAVWGLAVLAALSQASAIVHHETLVPSTYSNTPTTRSQWGNYSIDTNYYEEWPNTGVTREVWALIP